MERKICSLCSHHHGCHVIIHSCDIPKCKYHWQQSCRSCHFIRYEIYSIALLHLYLLPLYGYSKERRDQHSRPLHRRRYAIASALASLQSSVSSSNQRHGLIENKQRRVVLDAYLCCESNRTGQHSTGQDRTGKDSTAQDREGEGGTKNTVIN